VQDPASITAVARELTAKHPTLNVLINNAGIMQIDNVAGPLDDSASVSIITTNLLGPLRMTSALIDHLKKQKPAAVINVSSGLAFVPLTMTAVYSATKAAIHSYTMSLRYKLRDSSVAVLEIIPPWVQTDLLNSKNESRAMPLADFLKETMKILGTDADEIVVERARPLRENPGPDEEAFVTQFNEMIEKRE
jgi:uncharacterized oxidoreductase